MGRFLKGAFFIACASLFLGAPRLLADGIDNFTYQTFQPDGSIGSTFTWQLPASPTSLDLSSQGVEFGVITNSLLITFLNGSAGGGLQILDAAGVNVFASAFGPQVYTGNEDPTLVNGPGPTFIPNTYALTDDFTLGPATLTIAPVPEPSSLLLFASGVLALGVVFAIKKIST